MVVPLQAKHDTFTTLGFDNIDHNPRATTRRYSLHGTCISVLQFPTLNPTSEFPERLTDSLKVMNPDEMGKNYVDQLPGLYTNIPEISLPKDNIHVPSIK